MDFTNRFNELLTNSNETNASLASALGISRQAITNLKSGFSLPSLFLLCKICEHFDVSADYLLGLSDY